MSTENGVSSGFEHVNLAEVDPGSTRKDIPEGVYTFEVLSAEFKKFQYQKGERAGKEGERIEFAFVITEDPEYSGRRIYQSLFEGKGANMQLRRMADATGIEAGTVPETVQALVENRVRFTSNAELTDSKDKAGQPTKRLAVNLWNVQPA